MEARFLTPLDVRKIGERTWILLADLVFYSARYGGTFTAPRGFQTDLASIPRAFYVLFPPVGHYDAAGVVHDASYAQVLTAKSGRRQATVKAVGDLLFDEAMAACGVNRIARAIMYRGVVAFGNPDTHPLKDNRLWA